MRTETKVLILFLILFLSIGPISYFFGTSKEFIPNFGNETSETIQETVVLLSGVVESVDPSFIIHAEKEDNKDSEVRQILKEFPNTNLTVTLSQTKSQYSFDIYVSNVSDSYERIKQGFLLRQKLAPFFREYISYSAGVVSVSQGIYHDNSGKNYSLNTNVTLKAILAYFQEKDNKIQLLCRAKVSKGTIVGISSCYDATSENKYGLDEKTFSKYSTKLSGKISCEGNFTMGEISFSSSTGKYSKEFLENLTKGEVHISTDPAFEMKGLYNLTIFGMKLGLDEFNNVTLVPLIKDYQTTIKEIEKQLGFIPEHKVPSDRVSILFKNESLIPKAKEDLEKLNVSINGGKQYLIKCPKELEIQNKTYENLVEMFTGVLPLNSSLKMPANAEVVLLFDKIVSISLKS
ncbi:MAG: hypothetical protein QW735_00075 [archaeon]